MKDFLPLLSRCRLCPRECGADRARGEKGFCGVGLIPRVAAVSIHHGEEPPLSGTRGAGNVFFSGCNLRCSFCQNFPISSMGAGKEIGIGELATEMLNLQKRGAHNVNLVTAAHLVPQIAVSVRLAREMGLTIPIVYNTNGYEKPSTLELLAGTVDVYLPDMKYAGDKEARRCSGAPGYVSWNRRAVLAMYAQVGGLVLDKAGIARRGLIVRHLVLPGGAAGTGKVLKWLAGRLGRKVHLSLMFQYFPAHRAVGDLRLGRRLTQEECREALDALEEYGFKNGWIQDLPGACPERV